MILYKYTIDDVLFLLMYTIEIVYVALYNPHDVLLTGFTLGVIAGAIVLGININIIDKV